MAKQQTPDRNKQVAAAVLELMSIQPASGEATPEQIRRVGERFDVELHTLEGLYLDMVDRLADA